MRQFKCHTNGGKSRLRGLFRHQLWLKLVALGINLKRIYEYCLKTVKKQGKSAFISLSHIFALLIATLVAIIVVIQAHFEMLLPKLATTNPNSQAEQIHKN